MENDRNRAGVGTERRKPFKIGSGRNRTKKAAHRFDQEGER